MDDSPKSAASSGSTPTVVITSNVIVYDEPSTDWNEMIIQCYAVDAQWESGGMVFFNLSTRTGTAMHLASIAGIALVENQVTIELHAPVLDKIFPSGVSQQRATFQFSDAEEASEWKKCVLGIWPNPFISNQAEYWTQIFLIFFMFLQCIPVIGPFFGIPIMLWNAYLECKEARQKTVLNKGYVCCPRCCPQACERSCMLPCCPRFVTRMTLSHSPLVAVTTEVAWPPPPTSHVITSPLITSSNVVTAPLDKSKSKEDTLPTLSTSNPLNVV